MKSSVIAIAALLLGSGVLGACSAPAAPASAATVPSQFTFDGKQYTAGDRKCVIQKGAVIATADSGDGTFLTALRTDEAQTVSTFVANVAGASYIGLVNTKIEIDGKTVHVTGTAETSTNDTHPAIDFTWSGCTTG